MVNKNEKWKKIETIFVIISLLILIFYTSQNVSFAYTTDHYFTVNKETTDYFTKHINQQELEEKFNFEPASIDIETISEVFKGRVMDIQSSGNYAYLATDYSVEIIDITDKYNPVLVGSLPYGTDNLYISGSYLCINSGYTLRLFDITNPTNPIEEGYIGSCRPRGIEVVGNYAYIANDYGPDKGLVIFDISNPTNIIKVGNYSIDIDMYDIDIEGNYAYCANYYDGAYVFNITDPINPSYSDSLTFGERAFSLAAKDSIVYVGTSSGIQILNATDPYDIFTASTYSNYTNYYIAEDIVLSGNLLYYTNYHNSFGILNITEPFNPVFVSNFITDDRYENKNIFLQGDYAFFTSSYSGLHIVDITNPYNPVELSSYDKFAFCKDVKIRDGIAYIAGKREGLILVNVSDIYNPEFLGEFHFGDEDLKSDINEVFLDGNYAYLADNYNELQILDITDLTNPIKVANYSIDFTDIISVKIKENYAYLASYTQLEMIILDISDPTNPVKKGNCSTFNYCYSLFVRDNYTYISGANGIQIINTTLPESPENICTFNNDSFTRSLVIKDNLLYAACSLGLRTYDITDLNNPILINTFTDCGSVDEVDVRENIAFIAGSDYNSKFALIDISNPYSPLRISNNYRDLYYVQSILIVESIGFLAATEAFFVVEIDQIIPEIRYVNHSPLEPISTDFINISADVNIITGIEYVTLNFRVDSETWFEYEMTNNGSSNYIYQIGPFPTGSVIEYYILAVDKSENPVYFIEDNSGAYYTVTVGLVIPELNSKNLWLSIFLSGILVSIVIPIIKRKDIIQKN